MKIEPANIAEAASAVISGQIDVLMSSVPSLIGQTKGGKARILAVSGDKRLPALPDVPTFAEAGLKEWGIMNFNGLWAPKGTPKEIIAKLNAAVVESLADPVVQQRLKDIGQEPWPRDKQTPEALAEQQKNQIAVWWPVIKANNIKGE